MYSQDAVDVVESTVKPYAETQVYMLAGDSVEERREPKEDVVWYGDESIERLMVHWTTPTQTKMEWMFVPLTPVPEKGFDPLGKFLIWEEPREGFDYSIGVDTGTGVGGDRSTICVTRHGTNEFPDEQVAEFASDSIPNAEFYIWFCAAAALYSRHMKDKPHPKIAVEMVRKFGDLPYHLARGLGFKRWHEWGQGFDRKTFNEKVGKHGRVGWYTNAWSRPLATVVVSVCRRKRLVHCPLEVAC